MIKDKVFVRCISHVFEEVIVDVSSEINRNTQFQNRQSMKDFVKNKCRKDKKNEIKKQIY